MAFPTTVLPVKIEMWTGSSWVDITSLTRATPGDEITVKRGYPDETNSPEPCSITLKVNNASGNLSPRNPTGTYYGLIGRNTPVRVSITGGVAGPAYLHCEGRSDWFFSYANAVITAVTGDIDVRVDAKSSQWATNTPLLGVWRATSDKRAWALLVDGDGKLAFYWSTGGTSGTVLSATSSVVAGLVDGERKAIRATLDVDNGAAEKTVTFYTADTIDGTWVQLGSAQTTAGTTSIFSDVFLQAGHLDELSQIFPTTKVYAAQVLNGIAGSARADIDFTTQASNDTSFVDDAGVTWTVGEGARIADPGVRGIAEVSEWPPRWDLSGNDVWMSLTAQGVLRRLNQGRPPALSPFRSAIARSAITRATLAAWWPMEDAGGTSFAPGLVARTGSSSGIPYAIDPTPMTYSGAAPEFAGSGPFLGTDSVAVLASTTSLTGLVSPVVGASGTGPMVGVHLSVPATTGWTDSTPILWLKQSASGSTVTYWEIRYRSGSGGDLEVRALDGSGVQVATSGSLDFNIDGQDVRLFFDALNKILYTRQLNSDGTAITETSSGAIAALSALTATYATELHIAPTGGLTNLGVGQATVFFVQNTDVDSDSLLSYLGEYAATRADRLIGQAGIESRLIGTTIESEQVGPAVWFSAPMGEQDTPSTVLDALSETWLADQAFLFESRDELGLTFRTRRSLYNQAVALTLDYEGAGEIAPDLEPTDDDQLTANSVTVTRKNGSEATFTDSTSRMGTQSPPDGVGPYETSVEINIDNDDDLIHHASWRVHLGTWDEARIPKVVINMRALAAQGKTDLLHAAADLDVGDRIRLTNLPVWAASDDVDLLVLGTPEEKIGQFEWTITLNCRPYGPWIVQKLADAAPDLGTPGRLAGDARCATRGALGTGTTSVPFDPNLFRWTTDSADFNTSNYPAMQVRVGGELWTASAISTTAATFVAVGTAANADNAAIAPGVYAGAAADDWVLVVAYKSGSGSLAISDANYTYALLGQQGLLYVWATKRTSLAAAPTVTPSDGAVGDVVIGVQMGLRSMGLTLDLNEYVVTSAGSTNSSAQDIVYSGYPATIYPGVVHLLAAGKADDWTGVAGSAFTEALDTSTTTGNDAGLWIGYRIDTTPTAVAPSSLTVTGGAAAVSASLLLGIAGGFQTITVTRSVNGVSKSHTAGALIALENPLVVAL